ncbi:hypothetical protein ACJRO7_028978 [Eucalyptus globulus]|uniref:Leucine-rich repeat-containing N-terminal plant-type domain-containing protein n=1 Tax=Eucalyptus globulus TaxID=34317 RepID=A0ABD3JZ02_EUCGL
MESLAGAKANVTIISFLWLATLTPLSIQEQDDVQCLQGTKDALADPGVRLSSWNFTTEPRTERPDPRVASALQKTSLAEPHRQQHLRENSPSKICGWLPYLTSLGLSGNNNIIGFLPSELANCIYLNFLDFSDNKLSGTILPELAKLVRLIRPSIAGSDPSGKIPPSFAGFNATSFSGNRGLCSAPLGRCGRGKRNMVIVGCVVGGELQALGLVRTKERTSNQRRHRRRQRD